MICKLCGPDLGVAKIPEAMLVEWREGSGRVVFSYARQGNALSAHFACGKESLRMVKDAINDWCEWALWAYPWAEMIFAVIGIKSVERIVKKCGFEFLTEREGFRVFVRYK